MGCISTLRLCDKSNQKCHSERQRRISVFGFPTSRFTRYASRSFMMGGESAWGGLYMRRAGIHSRAGRYWDGFREATH